MKRRVPNKIRVLGKNYRVKLQPGLNDKHNVVGQIYYHKSYIVIEPEQTQSEISDTLLHETIHAIDYNLDLKLAEHQVHALASGLYQVFADNGCWIKKVEK